MMKVSNFTAAIQSMVRRVVDYLETADIPFGYFILTFLSAVTLRNLFEQLLPANAIQSNFSSQLFHYYLSYSCIALSLIILFRMATGESMARISRVILPSFIILNIVPLIDGIVSIYGRGYTIGYVFPGDPIPLWQRFLTFFGPSGGIGKPGATPGIRVEIGLVLLASSLYFSIKGLNGKKNLLWCVLLYALFFFYYVLPCFIAGFLQIFGISYHRDVSLLINFHLLLLFFLAFGLAFLGQRSYWLALMRDSRILRVLHYELMFFIGLALAARLGDSQVDWDQQRLFAIVFVVIAILSACFFSLMTNNLADLTIDAISSPDRPSVSGAIPLAQYRRMPWFFLGGAFLYSWMADFSAFFTMAAFVSAYYLYSMPPLRLKRIPVLSKLCIVFNSLLLIALGFYLEGGTNLRWVLADSATRFFFI